MHTIEERTGLEVLDDKECQLLLGRATLGRLAAVVDGRPSIFPVNFRRYGGSVVFRSDEGTKLDAAAREQPVALEVDEVDSRERSGWSRADPQLGQTLRTATEGDSTPPSGRIGVTAAPGSSSSSPRAACR